MNTRATTIKTLYTTIKAQRDDKDPWINITVYVDPNNLPSVDVNSLTVDINIRDLIQGVIADYSYDNIDPIAEEHLSLCYLHDVEPELTFESFFIRTELPEDLILLEDSKLLSIEVLCENVKKVGYYEYLWIFRDLFNNGCVTATTLLQIEALSMVRDVLKWEDKWQDKW